MAILFITNYYPDPRIGGIERVTKILSEYFVRERIGCHCLFLHRDGESDVCGHMKCIYVPDKYDMGFFCRYVADNDIKVIINQSNHYYTPFLRKVCDVTGAKLITCLHNSIDCKAQPYGEAVEGATGVKRILIALGYPLFALYSSNKLKRQHRRSYELSDLTVLLSKMQIAPYERTLGVSHDEHKLTYVNNPLSFAHTISSEDLQNKEKVALVVSRLYEPQKKLSILFDCWAEIERRCPDWRLIVVGDGPDRRKYERQVARLNCRNVLFTGSQPSYPYYKIASIFCMTSIWEGFPMTILESLQMGVVPVVMDAFPALHDMVTDGVNGCVVRFGDRKAYVEALVSLMHNAVHLSKMRMAAVENVTKFHINTIGLQWKNLMQSV